MAGESARESARRQREKAERLTRSAELWERGAEGEQATAEALAALPSEQWTVFHDVRWPGRRYANVDHVVVGPAGVFVIDSKNWSGAITVEQDVLRQNGRVRETAVAGAAEAGLAIAELAPLLRPDLVKPVLCFVRDEPVTGWARDVMICSTANVADMLLSRPAVLTPEEARDLAREVDAGLRAAAAEASVARPRHVVSASTPMSLRPAKRRTSGRRGSAWGEVLGMAMVLVVAWILLTRPAVVGEVVSGWFTDGPSQQDAPAGSQDDKSSKQEKQGDRQQRQP